MLYRRGEGQYLYRIKTYLKPLFVAFIVLTPFPSFGHKVHIFAYVEDNTVYTESYFSDGTSVTDATVKVFDGTDYLLLSGHTNQNGQYNFAIPKRDDLTIVVEASMGHRALYTISREELKGSFTDTEKLRSTPFKDESDSEMKGDEEREGVAQTSMKEIEHDVVAPITIGDIRRVVREEVSVQLEPIKKKIGRESGISVREIFAGIGYILGLMGLIMYFQSRRKK